MSFHWTDAAREELETKAAGDQRELMVHVHYPADSSAAVERAAYLPDVDALRDELKEAQRDQIRAMRSFSGDIAPLARDTARYPVAVFMPGAGMKALMYQALIEDLASHGWVVAAVDPPYNFVPVRFSDGRVLGKLSPEEQGWPKVFSNGDFYRERMKHWSRDVSFVIDQLVALDSGNGRFARRLDLKRGVGVFGHSNGGSTAGTSRILDARVGSAINLDGTGPNGALYLARGRNDAGTQPLLWVLRGPVEHEVYQPYRALGLVGTFALRVFLNRPGFKHDGFADEPFWDPSSPAERRAKREAMPEIRTWVRAFFEATVRGDRTGLDQLTRRPRTETRSQVTRFGLLKPSH